VGVQVLSSAPKEVENIIYFFFVYEKQKTSLICEVFCLD